MLKRLFGKKPKPTEPIKETTYIKEEQECIELFNKLQNEITIDNVIKYSYNQFERELTFERVKLISQTFGIIEFNKDFTIQEIKKVLNHAVEEYERLKKIKEDSEQKKIKDLKSQIEKLC